MIDDDRRQPDEPDRRDSATGTLTHAIGAGLEVARETSENFARTGPTAPHGGSLQPGLRTQPYPGPITRTGASTDGTADSVGALRVRHGAI